MWLWLVNEGSHIIWPAALFMTEMRRLARVALNMIKCCFCIYHAHIDPNKLQYLSLFRATFHQALIVKPVLMTNTGGENKKKNTTMAHQLAGNLGNKALLFFFQRKKKKIICLIELRNIRRLTTPQRHSQVCGGDWGAPSAKQRSQRTEENGEDRMAVMLVCQIWEICAHPKHLTIKLIPNPCM